MNASLSLFRAASSRRSQSALMNTSRTVVARRHYSESTSEPTSSSSSPPPETGNGKAAEEKPKLTPEQEKLAAKEAEVVDLMSRLRYLQADFLNLQRNSAREKEQQRDFAITKFAGDLLESVDVLALALKSVPESALTDASDSSSPPSSDSKPPKSALEYLKELHLGVEMTHRLLLQTLFKYHVKPFDPTGDVFDPNRHEALYQAPVPGKKPGTVIDCQKVGYTIKERTLRAAQVGVAQDTS